MANVEIYTTRLCGFCARAKMLLNMKGVPFTEIAIDMVADKRAEMIERSGGDRKVPQIFIDGAHIGGCDELEMLEFDGELDKMLNADAG